MHWGDVGFLFLLYVVCYGTEEYEGGFLVVKKYMKKLWGEGEVFSVRRML